MVVQEDAAMVVQASVAQARQQVVVHASTLCVSGYVRLRKSKLRCGFSEGLPRGKGLSQEKERALHNIPPNKLSQICKI